MTVTVIVSAISNLGTNLITRHEVEAEKPTDIDIRVAINCCMKTIQKHSSETEYFKIKNITTRKYNYEQERENYIYP